MPYSKFNALGPIKPVALFSIHLMIDCLCGDLFITTWNKLAFVWKTSKEKCSYIVISAQVHTCKGST